MNTVAINHTDWYCRSVGLKVKDWEEDNKSVKSSDVTIHRSNVTKFAMTDKEVAQCLESIGAETVRDLLEIGALGALVDLVRHRTSWAPGVPAPSDEDIILRAQEFVAQQQRPAGITNELDALGGGQAAGDAVDAAVEVAGGQPVGSSSVSEAGISPVSEVGSSSVSEVGSFPAVVVVDGDQDRSVGSTLTTGTVVGISSVTASTEALTANSDGDGNDNDNRPLSAAE